MQELLREVEIIKNFGRLTNPMRRQPFGWSLLISLPQHYPFKEKYPEIELNSRSLPDLNPKYINKWKQRGNPRYGNDNVESTLSGYNT